MSQDWNLVPLSQIISERQEVPSVDALIKGEICIIEKIGFNDGKIQLRSNTTTKTNMILIQPGDLVVSGINAAKGAIAVFDENNTVPIAATIHYSSYIINKQKADIRYLWWLLRSHKFKELLLEYVPGGIKTELKAKRLLPVPIPLPLLEEQRRIVARVEEMVGKIEEVRSLRKETLEASKVLTPVILGEFFRNLAQKFEVKSLGSLSSSITDGPHKTPNYVLTGIPFVTVRNMVTGQLNFDYLQYITLEDHTEFSKRCKPEHGDVLYSKDGATRGVPCFINTDREFNIFVSVALIKPLRDQLDARYLCHLLNSTLIKERMIDKSKGDMIPHIVLREIRQFPVPLPPISEQRRIVTYFDELQTKVDTMKRLRQESMKELDALLPSILDKAFKGEL